MSLAKHIPGFKWVPSTYFLQGFNFALITLVSIIFYKNANLDNAVITLLTSLLLIPWLAKPVWAPFLEVAKSKKSVLQFVQLLMALCWLVQAVVIYFHHQVALSIGLFLLMALLGATYDILLDGLYLTQLPVDSQQFFVGVRTAFYQLARLASQGGVVILAGYFAKHYGLLTGWQIVFVVLAGIYFIAYLKHLNTVPFVATSSSNESPRVHYGHVVKDFFNIPAVKSVIVFMLFYNAIEIVVIRLMPLYLLDPTGVGGAGFNNEVVGLLTGVYAVASFIVGNVIAGMMIARYSLQRLLLPFTLLLVVATLLLALMVNVPLSLWAISLIIVLSQFFYGLANSVYMAFLLQAIHHTKLKMSCYTFATTLMLGAGAVFASISGYLQQLLGYPGFFALLGVYAVILMIMVCVFSARFRQLYAKPDRNDR